MKCPMCHEDMNYAWSQYIANSFRRLACPQCGCRLNVRRKLTHTMLTYMVGFFAALLLLAATINLLVYVAMYYDCACEIGAWKLGIAITTGIYSAFLFCAVDKLLANKWGYLVAKSS